MKELTIVVKQNRKPENVNLGICGENHVRTVRFDISDYTNDFGEVDSVILWIKKPKAAEVIRRTLPVSDNVAEWVVADTEIDTAGYGQIQIDYINGRIIGKSLFNTTTEKDIDS